MKKTINRADLILSADKSLTSFDFLLRFWKTLKKKVLCSSEGTDWYSVRFLTWLVVLCVIGCWSLLPTSLAKVLRR